jgi:murein DD-endopeptidase MepM/ murein hydrolase activator NlpD
MRVARLLLVVLGGCTTASSPVQRAPTAPQHGLSSAKKSPGDLSRCPSLVLKRHRPFRYRNGQVGGHSGVDFAICDRQAVVAIAEGVVASVSRNLAPGNTGDVVTIMHYLPDSPNPPTTEGRKVVLYAYVHLTNVAVKQNERVSRGQHIGEAWVSESPHSSWTTHVHLEWLGSEQPEERDPLKHVSACLSNSRAHDLVYPVNC